MTYLGSARRIDPLDHFTKPEWRSILRRARIADPKIRDEADYSARAFLAIMTAAESKRD